MKCFVVFSVRVFERMDGSYDTMEQSNPMLREFVLHPGSAELMSQSSINSSDDPMQKSLNIKDLETVCT